MPSARGTLEWKPLADMASAVTPAVAQAGAQVEGLLCAPIDASLSDTAAFCEAYDVALEAAANCVIVEGRRGERITRAAVLVRGTDRADINKTVRKHLDVRKVSFAASDLTEDLTGMVSGGITPIGLPADWPVLVDEAVAAGDEVVIGAGLRGAKLLISGASLAALPAAEVLDLKA